MWIPKGGTATRNPSEFFAHYSRPSVSIGESRPHNMMNPTHYGLRFGGTPFAEEVGNRDTTIKGIAVVFSFIYLSIALGYVDRLPLT